MKLLIITQKVDRQDTVLGFFHRWLEEFSRLTELTVLGQKVGAHDLLKARVLSMGKESGHSRVAQVVQFWKTIIRERGAYDAVLVHMTPVWIVLGAPIWILLRKRMYLWYEVRRGGWLLRLAGILSKKVFSATEHGLPWTSRNNIVVGHGIDTEEYKPVGERDPSLVVAAGRITPVKHFDRIIRAFAKLPSTMRLQIAGGTVTENDRKELLKLQTIVREHNLGGRVQMGPGVAPAEIPALFRRAFLQLHACEGGLDKVVLEGMASGCPTVSTAEAAQNVLPSSCRSTKETFVERANDVLRLTKERRWDLERDCRERVVKSHSLQTLIPRLVEEMQ